jgi:hypothetical protein
MLKCGCTRGAHCDGRAAFVQQEAGCKRAQSASSSARSPTLVCPAADCRAITRMSQAGRRAWLSRKLSRICRRMRLRTTASLDTRRDTAIPKRAPGSARSRNCTLKCCRLRRRPDSRNRAKSAGRNTRAERGWRSATRILRDEFFAALRTTRVQNGAAAARFHACAKPVRAGVLEIAGLESALGGHDTGLEQEKGAGFYG